jgi:hypothetical protein
MEGNEARPRGDLLYLKNKRPSEWRDVQHLDQAVGHYILSNAPMTEEQWIAERTKLEPKQLEAKRLPDAIQDTDDTDKPLE